MKSKQNILGAFVLLSTFLAWLAGVGDTIKELNDWHGLAGPAVVGVLLSQFGKLMGAAVGGMLIDIRSSSTKERAEDRISDATLTEMSKKDNP
jgi:hypothetical protein